MKHFLTTFILLLITFTAYAQLSDTDIFLYGNYDKDYLSNNKIKEITVDMFINREKSTFYIFQFDRKGLLKKHTILNSTRKKVNTYDYRYNNNGDIIESINVDYNLKKKYKAYFEKIYKDSLLVSDKSKELLYLTEYFYNLNGQKTQAKTTLGADTLTGTKYILDYEYDKTGKMTSIKEIAIDNNGNINFRRKTTFSYDINGKIIAVIRDNAPTYFISYYKNGLLKSKKVTMPEDLGGFEIVDNFNYNFWK